MSNAETSSAFAEATADQSAVMDAEALALEFQQASAEQTHTIGDYTSDIREASRTLMQAGGPLQEVGRKLEQNAQDVESAAEGSSAINIDATLESGLNGFTKIGGSDSDITVNADMLSGDSKKLAETIKHEKRHNDQVQLQHGGQETILITASQEEINDPTLLYEGDTETHTAATFGRREGQPELYATGHDLAEEMQQTDRKAWNETLTETGDIGALQEKMWEQALREGKIDVPELLVQAEKTGYRNEAARVLSAHIKQVAV
jgi:hypothetical protein